MQGEQTWGPGGYGMALQAKCQRIESALFLALNLLLPKCAVFSGAWSFSGSNCLPYPTLGHQRPPSNSPCSL
jgi:hypothetical protein